MRPNLSVEKIAGALAVLGTSVVMAACGGGDKPAESPVTSTEAPLAGGEAKPGEAGCGAGKGGEGGCGAHKGGEGGCGANKGGEGGCGAKPEAKAG
ncbi:MAG: hypothetical protein KIS78_34045, partial [Labilithrix sp.]|nr:hypothetical protein [Labilithrix sp.]